MFIEHVDLCYCFKSPQHVQFAFLSHNGYERKATCCKNLLKHAVTNLVQVELHIKLEMAHKLAYIVFIFESSRGDVFLVRILRDVACASELDFYETHYTNST